MNVRELKKQIYTEAGSPNNFGGDFYKMSPELGTFSERLNKIGARNIHIFPPETVPDIDSTVELENDETESLIAEFRELFAKIR